MFLINKSVTHKSLGEGVVTEQTDDKIVVKFESRTITMQYPGAFMEFLTTTDPAIIKQIEEDVAVKNKSEIAIRHSVFELAMQNSTEAKLLKAKTKPKKATTKKKTLTV